MRKNRNPNNITPNIRKQIYENFNNKCIFCENKDDLVVHHINCDRSDNRFKNLLLVCHACHMKCHGRVSAKDKQDAVVKLRRKGMGIRSIADALKIGAGSVSYILRKRRVKDKTIEEDNWKNFKKKMSKLPLDKI